MGIMVYSLFMGYAGFIPSAVYSMLSGLNQGVGKFGSEKGPALTWRLAAACGGGRTLLVPGAPITELAGDSPYNMQPSKAFFK